MEAMTEMVQDVGLAQSIAAGLSKGQMVKPNFPAPPDLDAEKASVSGGAKMAVWESEAGKFLLGYYATERGADLSKDFANQAKTASGDAPYTGGAPTEATLGTYWADFSATPLFDLYCKYKVLGKNIASAPITPKLFEEMRPLGAPAATIHTE